MLTHCLNVASFFEKFAATWNFTDKICCIVIDNMVAAIGRTDYGHLLYIAHCLQLSILAGLKAADSSLLLAKCRHLVGNFKHSSIEVVIFHKLQQDVATRWNSTYMMLTRLLEINDAILQYYIDNIIQKTAVDLNWQSQIGTKWPNIRQS